VGIFSLTWFAVKSMYHLLIEILKIVSNLSGGLMSQLIAIVALVFLLPLFATVVEKGYFVFMWLLHHFE
jgi:hypothetical protein